MDVQKGLMVVCLVWSMIAYVSCRIMTLDTGNIRFVYLGLTILPCAACSYLFPWFGPVFGCIMYGISFVLSLYALRLAWLESNEEVGAPRKD